MLAKRYLQAAGAALVANSASYGWTLPTRKFRTNGSINYTHVAQHQSAIFSAVACSEKTQLGGQGGDFRDIDAMLVVCARLAQEGAPPVASLRARKLERTWHVSVDFFEGTLLGRRYVVGEQGGILEQVSEDAVTDPSSLGIATLRGPDNMQLLEAGLRWLRADVLADFATHRQMLHQDAEMFGAKGVQEIMSFREKFENYAPAYNIPVVWVDPENRVVTCLFECIIPGRHGKGTDVTFFDEDYLVRKVIAVRHTGGGPPAS